MTAFTPRELNTLSARYYTGDRPQQPIVVLVQPMFKRDPHLVRLASDHVPSPGVNVICSNDPETIFYYHSVHKVNDGCYEVTLREEPEQDVIDITFD